MCKNFRFLLIVLTSLALATPAFAVNVKLKGDFMEYLRATSDAQMFAGEIDTSKKENDSDFRYSERVRLTWIAEDDEKKVRATFSEEFDITAGNKGDGATRNGPGGNFEGDRTNFELRFAYIDFELPFDPATRVYMGLQPAETNAWVFCDNAMGVKLTRGIGDLQTTLAWYRNDTTANDNWGGPDKVDYADLFTLDLLYDFKNGSKFGGFAYYIDDGHGYNSLMANDSLPVLTWANEDSSVQTYWLGLNGGLERGNLFGGITAVYQGGTVQNADGLGEDWDISAYFLNVEGTIKLGKTSIQVGYLYSTGDDDNSDNDVENFFGIDMDTTLIGEVALSEIYDANAALYGPFFGHWGMSTFYTNIRYELNDKTDTRLGLFWLNSAEDIDGNELYGNGVKDSNIGYEIAGEVNYQITQNLSANLAAGYLIGADGWDAMSSDGDGDDFWHVISMVRFKF